MNKVFPIVWCIICLVNFLITCIDIPNAIHSPESYFFGSGPHATIEYSSLKAYLYYSFILLLWFISGSVVCIYYLIKETKKYLIAIHIMITALLILYNLFS